MRIWLVKTGEIVPRPGMPAPRLFRTGQFAYWASVRAEIVWWTSAFDYQHQEFISAKDSEYKLNGNLKVKALRGCGYRKNISVKRLLDQNILAFKVLREMRASKERPDLVFCASPPIELAAAAVKYGKENNVPVVLDLRDMWPDIFVDLAPARLRGAARLFLSPLFVQASKVFKRADALVGITEEFLDWGLSKAGRGRAAWDAVFPFTYNTKALEEEQLAAAREYWDKAGIRADGSVFRVCYLGNLTMQSDVPAVLRASSILRNRGRRVQFVIAGDGSDLEKFRKISAGNPDVVFTGWQNAANIYELMRRSSAGINPLLERYDFLATINNKAVEYLSAGLPVISCPGKGALSRFLKANECGISFDSGDSGQLSAILENLMEHPDAIKKMSGNALRSFHENFHPEKVNQQIFNHLARIVSEYAARSK